MLSQLSSIHGTELNSCKQNTDKFSFHFLKKTNNQKVSFFRLTSMRNSFGVPAVQSIRLIDSGYIRAFRGRAAQLDTSNSTREVWKRTAYRDRQGYRLDKSINVTVTQAAHVRTHTQRRQCGNFRKVEHEVLRARMLKCFSH